MPTFNTDTPKPGYVYDSSDDTWYPLAGIAVQSLDGLTDVVISSAASGQTLVYNGTNWVNTAETGDVSAVSAGTGITVTNGTGPIPSVAVDDTFVATTSNTMTLSNKTLTAPTLQNPSTTGGTSVGETIQGASVTGGTFIGAAITSSTIFATTSTLETVVYPVFITPEERLNVVASAATGTVNIDVLTAGVWYYTSNAGANHTLNFRGNSSTSLNNILAVNDSLTVNWLVTNGATAYYPNLITVDGATSGVSIKWSGGVAPSAGNASSIDAYSFTIVKTAATSYTVLAAGAVKYA
jgi:hypothetical protein